MANDQTKKVDSGFVSVLSSIFDFPNKLLGRERTSEHLPQKNANEQQKQLLDFLKNQFEVKGSRKAKEKDYHELDAQPLPSRAIDIYASLITQGELEKGEESSTYEVVTKNPQQAQVFDQMEVRTNLKQSLYSKVRTSCLYGFGPQEVVFAQFRGISKIKPIRPTHSLEYTDPGGDMDVDFPFKQVNDQGKNVAEFKKFQILPLKIGGDETRLYGKSILETVRKTTKIIDVLENSMAFRELNRAVQRWLWLIDSSGLTPDDAFNYVNRVMRQHLKPRYVDYRGNLNLSRSPLTDMSDIALPVQKDGAPVDVRPLPTDKAKSSLDVLQHFMAKFFGGIGIPNYYFSFEGARQVRSVSALTYTDILLARLIFHHQSSITSPMWDMYYNESLFHGIEDDSFKLVFPILGTVDEMMRYQILKLKVDIANTLRVNLKMVDDDWVYNFLKFAQKDVERLRAFRLVVGQQEQNMLQRAADGVLIQPVVTWGNDPDPFDVITAVDRQFFTQGQPPPAESSNGNVTRIKPTIPNGIPRRDSILMDTQSVVDASKRQVANAEMQLVQERLKSERTFQELLNNLEIRNTLENVNTLVAWKTQHDDPFNTGKLDSREFSNG